MVNGRYITDFGKSVLLIPSGQGVSCLGIVAGVQLVLLLLTRWASRL